MDANELIIRQQNRAFPSQETGRYRICQPNFGVGHSNKQFRDRRNLGMHSESIAFERASGHSHAIKPTMGKFNGHNLRFEGWERRKTDCLKLNLFATQEPFAQITQCEGESESGKSAALFNLCLVRYILVVFANVGSRTDRKST